MGDEQFFDSPLAKIRTMSYVVSVVRIGGAPARCGFAQAKDQGKILIWNRCNPLISPESDE